MFAVVRSALRTSSRNAFLRSSILPTLPVRFLATTTTWLDVTQEIKIDHDNVRDLYERYTRASSLEDKKVIANTLIREMSIHGDAEEISVYNDYKAVGLRDTAQHNKDEHAEIKKLVWKAEHAFTSSDNYDKIMTETVDAFLAHAIEEETEQHPKLLAALTPEQNDVNRPVLSLWALILILLRTQKIARTFLKARRDVPLRPHPLAPQTGGVLQKAMGMHGKIQDKVCAVVLFECLISKNIL
ncbi:hypothetical protein PHLCEN_2v11642 [Hermanssonia centrifuga]|uniref:Hemerythrin-like domain-containing protein n=1 Tax=Hermanssonia centrifuga TaxID=98765 RepID=A0A2R6NJK0_9APHY|nr:hypothetical protein PHLCEN_2v11642 [Hermanssonia centrifuga]